MNFSKKEKVVEKEVCNQVHGEKYFYQSIVMHPIFCINIMLG